MSVDVNQMGEINALIAQARFNDARVALRKLIREKLTSNSSPTAKTPILRWGSAADHDSVEELFALCAWETNDNDPDRLASDAQLLDECITKTSPKGEIAFPVAYAWLAFKCRPGASKDELNDAQQLLDRYLRQAALNADGKVLTVTKSVQEEYASLVELLTCRVLPGLGLVESAVSFVSKENARKDLLLEVDRLRLEMMVQKLAPKQSSTVPPQATGSAPQQEMRRSEAVAAPTAVTQANPPMDAQKMIEEFERQKRLQQEEQMKMVMITAGSITSLIVMAILVSERKRISKAFLSLGDLLFGDN